MWDSILLGGVVLSLLGNVYLAISWKRATAQALLADIYLKLLGAAGKQLSKERVVSERKERHVAALEAELVSRDGGAELVARLNRLHTEAPGGRAPGAVPIAGASARLPR